MWGCYFLPGLNPLDAGGGRFLGDPLSRFVYSLCRAALLFGLRRLLTNRMVCTDKAYAHMYLWPDSHCVSMRARAVERSEVAAAVAARRDGFPFRTRSDAPVVEGGMDVCNHLMHDVAVADGGPLVGAWNFVMHPVFVGKKVDPDGAHVRRWLPEFAHLPIEYIYFL